MKKYTNHRKEELLYKLVEKLNDESTTYDGIGIHESSFIDCRIPEEAYGYRIYHSNGYCFDICFAKQYDENDKEIESHYEYHGDIFDGFKTITLDEAITLIKAQ